MKPTPIVTLVRGILIKSNLILLAREKGEKHTFLPGGHVETGEPMKSALRREILEELGLDSSIGKYLGVVEHKWASGGIRQHELNHLFLVDIPSLSAKDNPLSKEPHIEFLWKDLMDLDKALLRPEPLVGLIQSLDRQSPETWWASTL